MNDSSRSTIQRTLRNLPVIIFILVLLFFSYTAYYYSFHISDSDFASEMVLGKLLADENILVSTDWFYSSEIRFFNINLVIAPMFKIFSDWRIVHFASTLIIQALLLLSYLYLSRRVGMKANAYFLSSSLMMLPISVFYGRLIIYQFYYTPSTIYGFLIVGLYLSFINKEEKRSKLAYYFCFIGLMALPFLSSFNGPRQIVGTILPLFLTAIVVNISPILRNTSKQQWYRIVIAGLVGLSAALGFIVYQFVLSQIYSVSTFTNSSIQIADAERLHNIVIGYLSQFGFQEGRKLFSFAGVLSIAGILAAVVFCVLGLLNLTLKKREHHYPVDFANTLYPIAMLTVTVLFLISPLYNNYLSYFLPAFVWIFPVIGILLNKSSIPLRTLTIKQIIIYIACLIMFANGIFYNIYYMNPEEKEVMYDQIDELHIDARQRLSGAIEYIENNGYEVGYARFWNANIVTEITNGRIPMITLAHVSTTTIYLYFDWLTNKQTREKSYVEDKLTFMLLKNDEVDYFSGTDICYYAIPVYEDEYYTIYEFVFSEYIWEYLLNQAREFHQYSVTDQLAPQNE